MDTLDGLPKAEGTVILSHALWRERYGGDPTIAGRRIHLMGETATVVGVLPASFEFPTLARVDLLVPFRLNEAVQRTRTVATKINAFGRLNPGVSLAQVRTALSPYFQHFLTTITPSFRKEVRLEISSLSDLIRQHARIAGWTLFGAVLAVLLIAWTNVANLWLARATSRQHETAIRAALGAGRARLILHGAAELALVSAAGWLGGLGMAAALLSIFRKAAPQAIMGIRHASLDSRVLLFSGAVLVVSIVAFSFLLNGSVSHGETASRIVGSRRMRLRYALITAQLAMSVFLVNSAGLLIHSLAELSEIRFGVRTEGVVTASTVLTYTRYRTPAERFAFVQRLETGLRRLPGVSAVAVADELPPLAGGIGIMYGSISVDGPPSGQGPGGKVSLRHITPEYFRALGIQLLRGRSRPGR